MTSTEANEFFANRTVEEVGGDTDQASTEVKRIQTKRPNRRTKARVVVTFDLDRPKETWLQGDTDAVDAVRRDVSRWNPASEDEFVEGMRQFLSAAKDWKIEVGK